MLMLCAVFVSHSVGKTLSREKLINRIDSNYSGINSYLLVVKFDEDDLSLRIWQQSEQWRQEWVMDSGQNQDVIAVAVGQGRFPLLSFGHDDTGPPVTMVLFEDAAWWEEAGLDFELQSYHFFHGRPALAVGMSVPGDPEPYLWMDNEDMVPLRMVFSEKGKSFELGWLEYRNVGNYKLPHKLIISSNDFEMICSLEWRGINSLYEDQLFSPEDLDQFFSLADLSPPDLVEDFYRAQAGLYK